MALFCVIRCNDTLIIASLRCSNVLILLSSGWLMNVGCEFCGACGLGEGGASASSRFASCNSTYMNFRGPLLVPCFGILQDGLGRLSEFASDTLICAVGLCCGCSPYSPLVWGAFGLASVGGFVDGCWVGDTVVLVSTWLLIASSA